MKKTKGLEAFIVEFYNRFGLKTPRFFQYIQIAGMIATVLGFVPLAVEALDLGNVTWLSYTAKWCIAISGSITWIISKLPVTQSEQQGAGFYKLPVTTRKQ